MHWRGLRGLLGSYYTEASTEKVCYVICPFIVPAVLDDVLSSRRGNGSTIVLTSWRKDHLLSGASSLATYEVCRQHGWRMFVNGRLHVKLYSRDLDDGYLGSANLTDRGIGDLPDGNHEVLRFVEEFHLDDRVHIHRLLAQSRLVTDDVYDLYRKWLAAQPKRTSPQPEQEDLDVDGGESDFLTSQLPHSDDPGRLWDLANGSTPREEWEIPAMEHDLAVFPVPPRLTREEFLRAMRETFLAQPFVSAFLASVDAEGMNFGRIKQWVKRNCRDVPVPHARDLTFVVQGLMGWIEFLYGDDFEVVVPGRHSQVLRRRRQAR